MGYYTLEKLSQRSRNRYILGMHLSAELLPVRLLAVTIAVLGSAIDLALGRRLYEELALERALLTAHDALVPVNDDLLAHMLLL